MYRTYNHVDHALLLQSTKALAKFVHEHEGLQSPVLNQIVSLLEADEFDEAAKVFQKMHFGAFGFADWFPPVVFPNEDPSLNEANRALPARWIFSSSCGRVSLV